MSAVTHICPECSGTGTAIGHALGFIWPAECPNCDGLGALDDNGEPVDANQPEKTDAEDD